MNRLFTAILCSQLVPLAVGAADRIPVFVRSAGAVGGFTDPDRQKQDSVKDLVKKLGDSKTLRPAETEAAAPIVVEVLGRETKRESNLFGRQNKSYLTVRVTAGDYSTEFTAESGSHGMMKGYGDAAGRLVKQLESWAEANRDKLRGLPAEK